MGEMKSLLNQVLAIRDDNSTEPDWRVWIAIERLAQHLDELGGEPSEEPIARLTADRSKPKSFEVTFGAPVSRRGEDLPQG